MFLIHNGEYKNTKEPLFTADSRGLRFGEGIFETMRLEKGTIRFDNWHIERLEEGLKLTGLMGLPPGKELLDLCVALCDKNKLTDARIRLTVSGGDGGLFDKPAANYTIETWELPKPSLQATTVLFEDIPKISHRLSHIKHNNFLPYLMAAKHAVQQKADESILINASGNICEGTISNIFIIKNKKVITPPLSEGCIAGVYRRFVLESLKTQNIEVVEEIISKDDFIEADEAFLTNTILGIRSISIHNNKGFDTSYTQHIKKTLGL